MLVRRRGEEAAKEVIKLRPHGVIAYIADRNLVDAAKQLSVPLVDTAISEVDVARFVSLDNREVGRLAAESLTRLGMKHFGYCGVRGKRASEERGFHFAECLRRSGHALAHFSQRIAEGESHIGPLTAWLLSLQRPVGILTFDDKLGERVLTACHWANLAVPEQVAILGIGNDDLVSKLTWPSLSSINVPAERIGFEAAEILDHAMRGQRIIEGRRSSRLVGSRKHYEYRAPAGRPGITTYATVNKTPQRHLRPTGISMRGTTAVLAVQDTTVESAARYIREHCGEAVGVEHVARAVGVSRRTLDRRFVKALGRSVHEELAAVRMQNACVLLSEGRETVAVVASLCGFRTAASFSRAFHRQAGCWPIEYRNRVRG